MSKIFIVEDCTKCPNFIPCTSPRVLRVGCAKLGNLGSPLNFIGGGFPVDCPLNDYEEPQTDVLDKIRAEIDGIEINGRVDEHTLFIRTGEQVKQMTLDIIDKYRKEQE